MLIAGGREELGDYALYVLRHISAGVTVWTCEKEVRDVLVKVLPENEVKLCKEDGWPADYSNDAVFVRIVNTPPPLPVSAFGRGELVLSRHQLNSLSEGVVSSC